MVEAAGGVVETLVSEQVDVDAALGFVYLGNLGRGDVRASVELHDADEQGEGQRNRGNSAAMIRGTKRGKC